LPDALTEAQIARHRARAQQRRDRLHTLPDGADHTVRARFFTPRSEAGFVGHATVAAQYVLSAPARRAAPAAAEVQGRDRRHRVRGTDAIAASRFAATPAPVGRELNDRERLAVLDALALASESLDSRIPLRIVGAGGTRLLIGVRGPEPLKHLNPTSHGSRRCRRRSARPATSSSPSRRPPRTI